MGAIFSKILGTASEPSASPILAVEGDITCCNCEESSSDSDAGTPTNREMALSTEGRR